jgi:hypothetical protein
MKLLNLSVVSAIAVASFLCIQAPAANAAAAMHIPAVERTAPSPVSAAGYYYYHGRRYPYRYHGQYFNYRYYRGGRYHYY